MPIIALTADVTTVDVEKCKAVGMNDYISKPIDDKLLYSKIIKYLKSPATARIAAAPRPPDLQTHRRSPASTSTTCSRITKSDARMAEMI